MACVGALLAAHHFEQRHHVGRREEVQADHILRPLDRCRDFVDIQRRGVGGEHGAGFGHRVEFAEHALLEVHAFEHGLDDHVAGGEVAVLTVPVMSPMRRAFSAASMRPRFTMLSKVELTTGSPCARDSVGHVQQRDRNARVRERNGDATAHGARADHAGVRRSAAGLTSAAALRPCGFRARRRTRGSRPALRPCTLVWLASFSSSNRPSANGSLAVACTASMAVSAAVRFGYMRRASACHLAVNSGVSSRASTLRSEVRRGPSPCAISSCAIVPAHRRRNRPR